MTDSGQSSCVLQGIVNQPVAQQGCCLCVREGSVCVCVCVCTCQQEHRIARKVLCQSYISLRRGYYLFRIVCDMVFFRFWPCLSMSFEKRFHLFSLSLSVHYKSMFLLKMYVGFLCFHRKEILQIQGEENCQEISRSYFAPKSKESTVRSINIGTSTQF